MLGAITSALGGIVKPIAGVIQKRNDNATALASIKAKAAAASVEADAQVTLSQAEWQLMGLKLTRESWKDEYLMIVFSLPLFAGLIPGTEIVAANVQALLGNDYKTVMLTIVGASFGVKLWKG